jgi:hypothetical protein
LELAVGSTTRSGAVLPSNSMTGVVLSKKHVATVTICPAR